MMLSSRHEPSGDVSKTRVESQDERSLQVRLNQLAGVSSPPLSLLASSMSRNDFIDIHQRSRNQRPDLGILAILLVKRKDCI